MPTTRTFIAIELSDEARAALTNLQSRLKTVVPPRSVRWSATKNIHLTLHFLGEVATGEIDAVAGTVEAAALACRPFEFTLGRLGCFPNIKRPRVIWVGVLGNTDTLVALHGDLGNRLKQAVGFSPDTRPYSPHLTLGRVNKNIPSRHLKQLAQILQQEQAGVGQLARLQVTEIALIKSELKPAGPVYTPLSRGKLVIAN